MFNQITSLKKFNKLYFLRILEHFRILNNDNKIIGIRNGKTWYIVSSLKREEINIPLYLKIHFLNKILFRDTKYWRITNIEFVYSPLEIIEAFLLLKSENSNISMHVEELFLQSDYAKIVVDFNSISELKIPQNMKLKKKTLIISKFEYYYLEYKDLKIEITTSKIYMSFFEKLFFKNEVY